MRESDLHIVAEIERQSFSDPWSMCTLREAIEGKNPYSYFHVVRLRQVLIAYVNYWLILDEAHIVNLAVSPAYRRSGLGKYLLAKSLEYIRDKGGRQVHLEVRLSNVAAQNLYRQFGFRLVHIRRRYYQDNGEDACVFHIRNLLEVDL
ncbi:MAG: ribosomal protein S18-alanine N-acetyltransferase [Candidatus Poribacteria bacterium]|nr:ribosomal protein S18-alanine N-acetyltransferase [Candidatus Poribacteria bacterium]MDE0505536.1 ribosomal protein S18-alanine N-acetyltransferase [Candidatus Poribacteria bacterium]